VKKSSYLNLSRIMSAFSVKFLLTSIFIVSTSCLKNSRKLFFKNQKCLFPKMSWIQVKFKFSYRRFDYFLDLVGVVAN
jgi:hypothetical protein